ncbi:MAG: lysophospholipid acyltransferase family protein [Deltaproteobacteria bacterium]|nr:lysophospholipid acyltransferase family protein [Deltaproteobacteria bacterium]
MLLLLRTVAAIIMTIVWTAIGMLTVIVSPTGRLYMYFAREGWARQILWLAGVRVSVKGGAGLDWTRPCVVVANHASQIDIPLLFFCLPMPFRFLAKRSLFYIPIFGWSLALARFVAIDRGSSSSARRSIARAAEKIRRGPSLAVFPEGTRTPDGAIHPFKSGAFIIASRAEVPILPVAVRGTYAILPKSGWLIRPGAVEVVIGAPIETTGAGARDKDRLKKRAEEAVGSMLATGEPFEQALERAFPEARADL